MIFLTHLDCGENPTGPPAVLNQTKPEAWLCVEHKGLILPTLGELPASEWGRTLGFYSKEVSRAILVRSGRETSARYKHCYPGQRIFGTHRTGLYRYTCSHQFFLNVYSKLVFLPRLNCKQWGGPLLPYRLS
jgi:hypothetical protein